MSYQLRDLINFVLVGTEFENAFKSSSFQTVSANNHKQYIRTLYIHARKHEYQLQIEIEQLKANMIRYR